MSGEIYQSIWELDLQNYSAINYMNFITNLVYFRIVLVILILIFQIFVVFVFRTKILQTIFCKFWLVTYSLNMFKVIRIEQTKKNSKKPCKLQKYFNCCIKQRGKKFKKEKLFPKLWFFFFPIGTHKSCALFNDCCKHWKCNIKKMLGEL